MLFTEELRTTAHTTMTDITAQVKSCISRSGIREGVCMVYSPHTTAGITINENADPDVQRDMLYEINKIVPLDDHYHHGEGNSAAHIKTTFTGLHIIVPLQNGQPVLGIWQGIYFCEYDGPRQRKFHVQVLKGLE